MTNKNLKLHNAFTLAEVLITIGIIGVVAAMTMPTLIQNYRNHVVETRLQKVYSVMNQAIKQSEVINGEKENWDFDDPQFYEKYLAPYLNVLKKETIVGTNYYYNGIYFNDGSLLIGKTSSYTNEAGETIAIAGGNKDYFFYPDAKNFNEEELVSRAAVGRTTFPFRFAPNYYPPENLINSFGTRHYKKGFEPYMHELSNNSYLYAGKAFSCNEVNSSPMFCTALIMMNGWKIPKDYPFKVR